MRVLMLADSEDECTLVKRAIRFEVPNARVDDVCDRAAFDDIDPGEYDLIVTDWRLLWAEGREVVGAARRLCRGGCPIVVMTDEYPECRAAALAAGADHCWEKSEASLRSLRDLARIAAGEKIGANAL
jgi:DNA-binding response OmpR family regulator